MEVSRVKLVHHRTRMQRNPRDRWDSVPVMNAAERPDERNSTPTRWVCIVLASLFVLTSCSSDVRTNNDEIRATPGVDSQLDTVGPAIELDIPGLQSPLEVPENASTLQLRAFDDQVVDATEYQASFYAFQDCAAGIGETITLDEIDPISGLIYYGSSSLDIVYGSGPLWDCYEAEFVMVESAFQLTDPAVLAQGEQDSIDVFNLLLRPCLETLGIAVPDIVSIDDPEVSPLAAEATAALNDGRCENPAAGGG